MSKVLVQATLYRPTAPGDIPAKGYIEARPSLRRDVDDSELDAVVLPGKFTAQLGKALTYTDDDDVEHTTAATAGVAWFWIDATDAGADADLWFWTFTERTDGGTRRYCTVPTSAITVDYDDLPDINPDDYTTTAPPGTPAFAVADAVLHTTITAETTTAITAAKDELRGGAGPALDTLKELGDKLADDEDAVAAIVTELAGKATAVELAAETLARTDADTALAQDITDEIAARAAAVTAEATARDTAIAAQHTADVTLFADAAATTTALAGKASNADLAAEAALARNGDNITSGTIADARIASTITRDSEVSALVAAELVTYQPGLEIGYAERTTSATSTQTAANATGTISGMSVTVTGAGRAVDIRFNAALSWNSVANKQSFSSLMVNGGASGAAGSSSSPVTTTGPGQNFTRRMVLTNGVSYTFTVALYTEAGGGTVTAFANSTYPMSLAVTNR